MISPHGLKSCEGCGVMLSRDNSDVFARNCFACERLNKKVAQIEKRIAEGFAKVEAAITKAEHENYTPTEGAVFGVKEQCGKVRFYEANFVGYGFVIGTDMYDQSFRNNFEISETKFIRVEGAE